MGRAHSSKKAVHEPLRGRAAFFIALIKPVAIEPECAALKGADFVIVAGAAGFLSKLVPPFAGQAFGAIAGNDFSGDAAPGEGERRVVGQGG